MSVELKIKSKHLALEPAIIRKEEKKLLKQIRSGHCNDTAPVLYKFQSLCNHRKWNVRNEARATFLARAYLEGKKYSFVEKKRNDDSVFMYWIVPRIVSMVNKYGTQSVDSTMIADWANVE